MFEGHFFGKVARSVYKGEGGTVSGDEKAIFCVGCKYFLDYDNKTINIIHKFT